MGEDVAFDRLLEEPEVAAQLSRLKPPPGDPALLARLIRQHVGVDLDLGLVGLDAQRRAFRRQMHPLLKKVRAVARDALNVDVGANLDLIDDTLQDLLRPDSSERAVTAYKLRAALECLANAPLVQDLSAFQGAPRADSTIQNVVDAIAHYFQQQGQPFTGEPRKTKADNRAAWIASSQGAQLTEAVLNMFNLVVEPQSLATFMLKARKAYPLPA